MFAYYFIEIYVPYSQKSDRNTKKRETHTSTQFPLVFFTQISLHRQHFTELEWFKKIS
jgi:hypothetical protein